MEKIERNQLGCWLTIFHNINVKSADFLQTYSTYGIWKKVNHLEWSQLTFSPQDMKISGHAPSIFHHDKKKGCIPAASSTGASSTLLTLEMLTISTIDRIKKWPSSLACNRNIAPNSAFFFAVLGSNRNWNHLFTNLKLMSSAYTKSFTLTHHITRLCLQSGQPFLVIPQT